MGEATRKKDLRSTYKRKKTEIDKSNRYLSWFSTKKLRFQKYPYIGVATMALGVIIFLISGGANSIN
tara:strand:- start:16 stop:216 length:201 start_codon:yes stop_codon:yes gene_type:complete